MNCESIPGVEFRVSEDGRSIVGVAVRYGDRARLADGVMERFQPGAFGDSDALPDVPLNLQHTETRISGPVAWQDSADALRFRAEGIEPGVAALIRRGAVRGVSVEFRALAENRSGRERIIERAELTGLAIVDRGAYSESQAEVRAAAESRRRSLAWL